MKIFDKTTGRELLGKVSGAISKTIDQVVDGVDLVADSAKLKMATGKLNRKLNDKKCELGTLVYQFYCEEQKDDSKILALCEEIKELEQELQRLETEGLEVKPPSCPRCQGIVDEKDRFCRECGNQLKE